MSVPAKGRTPPNSGRSLPKAIRRDQNFDCNRHIADALNRELRSSRLTAKSVMKWTGAGERTVKDWLSGKACPSGQHLVGLMRSSNMVLAEVLILAGRKHLLRAQYLDSLRNHLVGAIQTIDAAFTERDD
jgi:hypothetical protein